MDSERSYEAPQVVVLGTLEEVTQGLPLLTSTDVVLFYRGF